MEITIKIQIIKTRSGDTAVKTKFKNGKQESIEQIEFDKAKSLIKKFSMTQQDKTEKDGKTIYTYA